MKTKQRREKKSDFEFEVVFDVLEVKVEALGRDQGRIVTSPGILEHKLGGVPWKNSGGILESDS